MLEVLLVAISRIKAEYGSERFKEGDCASLVIALGLWLDSRGQAFNVGVIERFMDADPDAEESRSNKELGFPECFSHCYLGYQGHAIDIEGVDAWDNWERHLDLSPDQNKWGEYDLLKDYYLQGSCGTEELNSLRFIAFQTCVEIDDVLIAELMTRLDQFVQIGHFPVLYAVNFNNLLR